MRNSSPQPRDYFIKPHTVGVLQVKFGDSLSYEANTRAINFSALIEQQNWPEVSEVASTVASTVVVFNTRLIDAAQLTQRLAQLADGANRDELTGHGGSTRLWKIPVCFHDHPQFDRLCVQLGMSNQQAVAEITSHELRVIAIGFMPGQPYMGELSEKWDIPRREKISEKLPVGAILLAIRQMIIFSSSARTGWYHVGQSAFRCFSPERENAFLLNAGDRIQFSAVSAMEMTGLLANNTDGWGGARCESHHV